MFLEKYINLSKAKIVEANNKHIIIRQNNSRLVKIDVNGTLSIYYRGWKTKLTKGDLPQIEKWLINCYNSSRKNAALKNELIEFRTFKDDEILLDWFGVISWEANIAKHKRYFNSNIIYLYEEAKELLNCDPIQLTERQEKFWNTIFTLNKMYKFDKTKIKKVLESYNKKED